MNEEETKQIITQLEKQKIYKNWKELCEAMDWNNIGGDTKKKYLKILNSICEFHKDGQKIIIDNIYNNPLPIVDSRGKHKRCIGNARKEYKEYKIEKRYDNSIGIYKITLDRNIYIGSTVKGFRVRFLQHRKKGNRLITKNMLEQGAIFEMIQICDGMEENEIRHIEQQWIEEYRNNPEWIVVNSLDHVQIKGEEHRKQTKSKKQKYKKIKVKEEDYNKVIELLSSNNIDIIMPK